MQLLLRHSTLRYDINCFFSFQSRDWFLANRFTTNALSVFPRRLPYFRAPLLLHPSLSGWWKYFHPGLSLNPVVRRHFPGENLEKYNSRCLPSCWGRICIRKSPEIRSEHSDRTKKFRYAFRKVFYFCRNKRGKNTSFFFCKFLCFVIFICCLAKCNMRC